MIFIFQILRITELTFPKRSIGSLLLISTSLNSKLCKESLSIDIAILVLNGRLSRYFSNANDTLNSLYKDNELEFVRLLYQFCLNTSIILNLISAWMAFKLTEDGFSQT